MAAWVIDTQDLVAALHKRIDCAVLSSKLWTILGYTTTQLANVKNLDRVVDTSHRGGADVGAPLGCARVCSLATSRAVETHGNHAWDVAACGTARTRRSERQGLATAAG